MTTEQLVCSTCGKPFQATETSPGYGTDSEGWRYCYACCALLDEAAMRRSGEIVLYLSGDSPGTDRPLLSNWPGTLTFVPTRIKRSRASAFGRSIPRVDAWFEFEGAQWHCVNRGNSQIARCRRLATKGPSQ